MQEIMCERGKQMEFDSVIIPGVEEYEDFFKCDCGKKVDYYTALEG